MSTQVQLHGVVPIIPTPFRADESIDLEGVVRCVDFAVGCGLCAICLPAYASEFPKLTEAERLQVVETAIKAAAGKLAVLAQSNHPSARCAAELARRHAAVRSTPPLPCRDVFARGHRAIVVVGPAPE